VRTVVKIALTPALDIVREVLTSKRAMRTWEMRRAASAIAQWADKRGAAVNWPPGGEARDLKPLARLDADLAAADLVFLGEMNHFVHEKSDFRLLFARHLLARGFSQFAEELGWSDGRRLQAWFDGGDPAVFGTLSLFGATADLRADRDDRPTGILAASFSSYPRELMRGEQERFYRGLRKAAQANREGGRRIGYFCFDIDALPGGGYGDIARLLAPYKGGGGVEIFLAGLKRTPGETAAREAARLRGLEPILDAVALDAPATVTAEVRAALAALADSLTYVERAYPAKDYEALRPGMAYREDAMKRRFADIRRLSGGAKTVVMSHAFHLAKDDRLFRGAMGVGPGGGQTTSIGHHLAREVGLKAYSIWMLYGGGEDSQPFNDLPRKALYPADSLNAQLAQVGRPMLLRIADAPAGMFDRPVGVGHMYSAVVPTILNGQVDAILFLPTVSPMRV
jgi:erythromycin esterase-like protein